MRNPGSRIPLVVWFSFVLIFSGCFLYPRDETKIPRDNSNPAKITISPGSGFFTGNCRVTLACDDPAATLYYTVDGSLVSLEAFTFTPPDLEPVVNTVALVYAAPVDLATTALVRARAFRGDTPVSGEYACMYFIDETTTLPVFSLVMNPYHLWDDRTGIYVPGPPDTTNPRIEDYGKENYFQDWERPGFIEFFETDRDKAFALHCGIRIFGGWSREFDQKSLAVFARPEYGAEAVNYDFFGLVNDEGAPITCYKSIVLRNSGDDWYRTMFRDALLQSLLDGMDVDRQAYKPALLFLNGKYWGIHNIREKVNEDYLAAHYTDVDADYVDILAHYDSRVVKGDNMAFLDLLDFAEENDMRLAANYTYIAGQVDIANVIDYTIAQLYINNTDWPFSNIKWWRPRMPDGKWRWIIYDTDSGFGGKDWAGAEALNNANHNGLTYLFSEVDAGSDFRTLFVNLAQNSTFRAAFLTRFRALLTGNFTPAAVVDKIDAMAAVIAPEIPRHQDFWHAFSEDWATVKVQVMRTYASDRYANWSGWLDEFEAAWSVLIKNGDFTSSMFWSGGWVDDEKAAAFTFNAFAGGEAGGAVTANDPNREWGDIVMFCQDGILLEAGKTYTLSFAVSATPACLVGVALVNPDTWDIYTTAADEDYYIADSSVPATWETTFNMPVDDGNVRLLFVAGKVDAGTSVFIDNVGLTEP